MKITLKEIDHLAALSRLDLNKEERELFAVQVTSILEFVEQLQKVDTKSVLPASNISPLVKHRSDSKKNSDNISELLEQPPVKEGNLIKTPPVL
ncbi:Asp-tRNA(Asn)/Glu-tRNA(Gln) amidotransferase subunit GatC [Patescibacteria group bacterium]